MKNIALQIGKLHEVLTFNDRWLEKNFLWLFEKISRQHEYGLQILRIHRNSLNLANYFSEKRKLKIVNVEKNIGCKKGLEMDTFKQLLLNIVQKVEESINKIRER